MKKEQIYMLFYKLKRAILLVWTLPRFLTAVILTLVIISYAVRNRPKEEEIGEFYVPVEYTIPANCEDFSEPKQQVKVSVKASPDVIQELQEKKLLQFKIAASSSGMNSLRSKDLVCSDPKLAKKYSINKIEPNFIQLDFDPIVNTTVRFNIRYNEGDLPKGYELQNKAELNKYKIDVSGARRNVSQLSDEVSSKWISLSGMKQGKNVIKVEPSANVKVAFAKPMLDVEFVIGEKKKTWEIHHVKVNYLLPDNLVFRSSPPDEVMINVEGPELLEDKWTKDDFEVNVQIPGRAESLDLTPNMVTIKEKDGKDKVKVIGIDTKNIKFELDNIISQSVRIKPVIGTIAEGYALKGELKANPKDVVVKGSERLLKGIKEIQTEPVSLTNDSEKKTTAKLVRLAGIFPEVDSVQIEYLLELTKGSREFSHIPIRFELKNDVIFQSEEPPEKFIFVKISGPTILVDKIRERDITVTKQITDTSSRISISKDNVKVSIPEEMKKFEPLLNIQVDEKPFSLLRDKYIASKELTVNPVYTKKLPLGYYPEVTPVQNRVNASGPDRFLGKLKEVQTEPIPVENLKPGEEMELAVPLVKPGGIKLEADAVKVKVKVSGLKSKLLKNVKIQLLLTSDAAGKNQSYAITPSQADFELEYPPNEVEGIVPEKLHAYITPSRDVPGIYDCNIIYWYDQPDVKVKSVTPAAVKLEIKASPKEEPKHAPAPVGNAVPMQK